MVCDTKFVITVFSVVTHKFHMIPLLLFCRNTGRHYFIASEQVSSSTRLFVGIGPRKKIYYALRMGQWIWLTKCIYFIWSYLTVQQFAD